MKLTTLHFAIALAGIIGLVALVDANMLTPTDCDGDAGCYVPNVCGISNPSDEFWCCYTVDAGTVDEACCACICVVWTCTKVHPYDVCSTDNVETYDCSRVEDKHCAQAPTYQFCQISTPPP